MPAWLLVLALVGCGGDSPAPIEVRTRLDAANAEDGAVVVQGRLGLHARLVDGPLPAVSLGDGSLLLVGMDRLPNPKGLVDALDGQRVRVEGDLQENGPGIAVAREPRPQGDPADLVVVAYTVEAASLSVGGR
jgi:hypothetical protein